MCRQEFDCKLAHLDEIRKISGFNSIKELYERVNQTFNVPINQVSSIFDVNFMIFSKTLFKDRSFCHHY